MPPETAPRPRLRERVVAMVTIAYFTPPERGQDGVERRLIRNADRFDTVVIDSVEEARLESLGALAPLGWGRAEIEADIEETYRIYADGRRQVDAGTL